MKMVKIPNSTEVVASDNSYKKYLNRFVKKITKEYNIYSFIKEFSPKLIKLVGGKEVDFYSEEEYGQLEMIVDDAKKASDILSKELGLKFKSFKSFMSYAGDKTGGKALEAVMKIPTGEKLVIDIMFYDNSLKLRPHGYEE